MPPTKKEPKKVDIPSSVLKGKDRIQTAEGWKRNMIKQRKSQKI
jgi:hypothetical protein